MANAVMGRPTVMTPDVKDLLIEAIEAGTSNWKACRDLGISKETFYSALSRDPEFADRYSQAKRASVDVHIDEAEQAAVDARMAENGSQVAGAKVFIDHKWRMASRLAPQRWGEKSMVHVTGQISTDETDMAKRVAFLQALNASGPGDAEPDDEEESLV